MSEESKNNNAAETPSGAGGRPSGDSSNIFLGIIDGLLELLWAAISWSVRIIWKVLGFCAGILANDWVRAFGRKMDSSAWARRIFFGILLLLLIFLWMPISQYRGYFGNWHYYQSGVASWYGSGFYFRQTASGEWFLPGPFYTAAHKTLPLGTWVKVLNNENGKWVIVRINDRGPFVKGRVIDLTRAAARRIGIASEGIAKVTLYVRELNKLPMPEAAKPVITRPENSRVVIKKQAGDETKKTEKKPSPAIAPPKIVPEIRH